MIGQAVNAAILGFLLWGHVSSPLLVIWLIFMGLLTVGRYGLLRAYLAAKPSAANAQAWGFRFVVGVGLAGAGWGLTGILLFPEHSHVHQVLIGFVLAGMSAAAMSYLAPYRGAYSMFIMPAVLPYALRLFLVGDDVSIGMGAMSLLFIVLMRIMSSRAHDSVTESLKLRFENLALLQGIRVAKRRQETVNRELGAEIAEHRQAEAALKESEARFRTVCDSAPVMIWMSGPDKLCTYFNQPWLDFTGRSMEQDLGNGWIEGVHLEDLARCLDIYQTAFDARKPFTKEYRRRRADGEYRWIHCNGIPRFGPEEKFLGYIGSCIDVTEERMAEERVRKQQAALAHGQRLAVLGESAAALAHELNQPLVSIVNYVEGAKLRFQGEIEANPSLGGMLDQTARIARRAANVVGSVREFTRKSDASFRPVDVNQSVREAVHLFAPEAKRYQVRLRMRLAEELAPVAGDQVQIEQLLVNLLANGTEAMEGTESGACHVTVTTGLTAKGEIEIQVCDSGAGIAPAVRDRLFAPFFTTKPRGLGMGLAVCRPIVERHGGRIWADDQGSPGATFHVVLPPVKEAIPGAR
ncbi:MAG: ATP-binding protein [Gammaproteobacteria bacterium]